ncbi:hypothetical protein [Amycolatopsis anabasis]|uniref:hypothetical protein n=1 Tax=Amycolatopsis anabasis TaxID=1840409 RepID=UPI00131DFF90|nr:hypothetical protein [Amycolatopsis anabasis]
MTTRRENAEPTRPEEDAPEDEATPTPREGKVGQGAGEDADAGRTTGAEVRSWERD